MTLFGLGRILITDGEWGYLSGRRGRSTAFKPIIFCVLDLTSGERFSFWGHEGDRLASFIQENINATYVAHYATAEMGYLLRYGITLPDRWVDTFIEFRKFTNSLKRQKAGLLEALDYFGIPHIETAEKDDLRERCLDLNYTEGDKHEIEKYCQSDCDAAGALYQKLGSRVPETEEVDVQFLKAVARMELRGVPFDTKTCDLIRRSRVSLRKVLINGVNKVVKLYDKDGVFHRRALFAWAARQGIRWPLTWSDERQEWYRSTSDDVLKQLEGHSFLAEFRQIKKSLLSLGFRSCPWDGQSKKHYFLTSYLGTVTGRNTPSKFIFSAAKWMRSVIKPPKGYVLFYVDYVAQEVGIAAALAKDPALRKIYETKDAHIAFAILAGAAPENATKDSHERIRKQYKSVSLGVLYGQGEWGIADRLGVTRDAARRLLKQHKKLFPVYWRWADSKVLRAFREGEIRTKLGWRCRIPKRSNWRSVMNWPIQSTGADLMRLTMIYLDRYGVELLAPVHDGFLVQCKRKDFRICKEAIEMACATAVDQILPGFPLRAEVKLFRHRYQDDDANSVKLWRKICGHLVKWYPHAAKHLR